MGVCIEIEWRNGKMSKRVLNISDRFYSLINYGARTYGVSKTEFCNMLYESHLNLIKEKCKLIKLEKEKKIPSVSEHSKLMEEGLKLIADFDMEKAKELELTLKGEKHTAL